jgi:hypothetical protein
MNADYESGLRCWGLSKDNAYKRRIAVRAASGLIARESDVHLGHARPLQSDFGPGASQKYC